MSYTSFVTHVVLAALLCTVSRCQEFDPYSDGPHPVLNVKVNSSTFPEMPAHLNVWAPADEGDYPILYFLDGFGANTPGNAYDDVMRHIATHGNVVVLPWELVMLNPATKAEVLQSIIDWCKLNLVDVLTAFGASTALQVNFDSAIAMSHSAGGHILCEYLTVSCGDFQGMVMMSPVDGRDPWGIVDNFCTQPGVTLNFILPTLVIAAGLDNEPGRNGSELFLPCGPEEMSNERFYTAMDESASKWFLNATEYGHADFMNTIYEQVVQLGQICAYNEDASALDFARYRDFIAGQVVSFTASVLSQDCSPYLPYLEDPALMAPIDVTVEGGVAVGACPVPGCSWTEP